MKLFNTLGSALAAGLLFASPASAADITSPMAPELKQTEKDGWTFAVAPYFCHIRPSADRSYRRR